MRIGKLRHYLTIERKHVTSTGDRGQPVYTWQTLYANVSCWVEPLQGRKLEIARQLVPTATHHVTLRFHDIDARDRFNMGGRVFNVGNINNFEERNIYMVATCTEETPVTRTYNIVADGGLWLT